MFKGNHGTNLKRHLQIHHELYEEYLLNELEKSAECHTPVKKRVAGMDLYQFIKPSIKVKTDMKKLINSCIELITVNGRPYSLLDDSGFRNIIDPILNGIQNNVVLNSRSIK